MANFAKVMAATAPALWWRCDEASGTGATDPSGNARGGTYSGSGYVLNQPSLLVADANPSVDLAGAAYILSTYNPFTGDRTFMGWARRTNSTTIDVLFGATATPSPYLRLLASSNDVQWRSDTSNDTNHAWTNAWPGNNVDTHWALTWNNTTKVAELLINAVSKGTVTSDVAFNAAPGNFEAGARGSTVDFFAGKMKDIAVHTRILSVSEIAQIYEAGMVRLRTSRPRRLMRV